ncbi:hypothetical protein NCCP2716_26520 [Sporosarcina sp. NCCP-2716]|uniref:DUF2207 domain-containing protein n=1 Tax=Sporosarcina sp. NCCP-2716 TaxID=2943679 RepID=UPI002040BE3E|nr:DUF2207 domain-containing protein [Sporosarcina sp. NCCP-2716]GKV70154.1 hypothetical protein NCCP2716_26520 [Sporosarcina sp. NCCP-2716]
MKKLISGLLILTMFLALPTAVSAKSFEIDAFTIDAQLEENGQVHVKEELTYRFSGSFNGITRAIYPKKGSEIRDVQASENGRELSVERAGGDYRVHRKAKDETVTIQLTYTIVGGVAAYTDMADFYWPFFDDRNETEFKDVTVTVHPPAPTADVIAFGYDAALTAPAVEPDGTVIFRLGKVPSEQNADIRVGMGMAVFPAMKEPSSSEIRPVLLAEKEKLDAKMARYERMHEAGKTAAPIVFVLGAAVFAALLSFMRRRKKERKREAAEQYPDPYFVPDQVMSLPATIDFTSAITEPESLLTSALLDLIRKGNIEREGDEGFRLRSRDVDHEHERLLLEWLFDKTGDGQVFRFSDLDVLGGKQNAAMKAAEAYDEARTEWRNAVSEEVKEAGVSGSSLKYALVSIAAGLLLVPPMIVFAVYGLPWWLAGFIPLSLLLIMTGIFNQPYSVKGYGVRNQWKSFAERMPRMTESDFSDRLDDDQKRAVIYAVGTNTFEKEKRDAMMQYPLFQSNPNMLAYFMLAEVSARQFTRADTAVAQHVSSSSSSGSSGGGTGGGGGGAGAF